MKETNQTLRGRALLGPYLQEFHYKAHRNDKLTPTQAVMSEWLRRLTRNQLGSSRAGSNPAYCDTFNHKLNFN